jgi:hypothetical protein
MKPELTRGARNLLRKAVEAIQRHPGALDMDIWMDHDPEVEGEEPYCGTVACLAGHIVLVAGLKRPKERGDFYAAEELPTRLRGGAEGESLVSVRSVAGRLLGFDCSDELTERLFHPAEWPDRFLTNYRRFKTARARANVLRDRVKHWLETGK